MIKKLLVLAMTLSVQVLADCNTPNNDPFNCCNTADACSQACYYPSWYGYVGSGYAWSFKPGIKNPDPSFWDQSNEGYDACLGGSPFLSIGIGKKFCDWLGFDVAYTYFQPFHYQKNQTGGPATIPGFTGTQRTRFFDLDHQNVIFNLNFIPENYFSLKCSCFQITPLFGVGIGVGIYHMTNFHTVGAIAPLGSFSVGSTSSIGDRVGNASFAWQGTGGIRFSPTQCSPLKFDIAYRYYDGGRFYGPSRVMRTSVPVAEEVGFVSGKAWKGSLRANELLVQLNWIF